jgi:preprotein translocase subunit SecG
MTVLFEILLFITALFLIVLVLVQRGKGGGLAGALGGMGGQSAFGTKAGDLFTRITIGVAAFWIILCAVVVWTFSHNRNPASKLFGHSTVPDATAPLTPEKPGPGGAAATPGGAAPAANTPAVPAAPAASTPPASPSSTPASPAAATPAPAGAAPASAAPVSPPGGESGKK